MNKFKVGDEVQYVKPYDGLEDLTEGRIYTVTKNSYNYIWVLNDYGQEEWVYEARFILYKPLKIPVLKFNTKVRKLIIT